jgi:antirestriction protein ArdC
MSVNATEIYEQITSRIQAALETAIQAGGGIAPWSKPWVGGSSAPRNLQSGKHYRGINALLLAMSDFSDPRWTTFNAARKMGGKVRKGEKSTLVTLWKRIKVKDDTAPNGEKIIAILRYFRVFNVTQVDWPEGVIPALPEATPAEGFDPHDAAEQALLDYIDSDPELSLHWGGNSAHYIPALHNITLPHREQFRSIHGFYGTAFHECGHSTGKKLGREVANAFGSDKYAREELIAEMAAAFVCATLGIDGGFDNSVSYLKGWRDRIAADPKLIVQAAGKAQKAADLILGNVIGETDETVPQTAEEVA